MECSCCGANQSVLYLDLGSQPLANSYHKGEDLPVYPLRVVVCTSCWLSYLDHVVNPDELFKNYLYVSGTTQTLKDHWKELAQDAVKRVGPNPNVIDVACNDCSNLEQFRQFTNGELLGVDPAANLQTLSAARKIPVVVDYWRKGIVPEESFDILTAANVVAHVADVKTFLEAAKHAIKPDGIIITEFPYSRWMLEQTQFDQIYHEHLRFYLVNSFSKLLNRVGLCCEDVILTSVHGGSIRFVLRKNREDHCSKLYNMIEEERSFGLLSLETYLSFGSQVEKNKNDLINLVDGFKKDNKKIVLFGASAKGNTMLNYFKLKFDYVVDENPLKHGYKTPGMDIPIVGIEHLTTETSDLQIILTAWNFNKEIKAKVRKIRGHNRDNFIYYVPSVHIE